jgi:hypothetical protein
MTALNVDGALLRRLPHQAREEDERRTVLIAERQCVGLSGELCEPCHEQRFEQSPLVGI